jgi:uncharacterized protein with HEPN domain
MMRSPDMFIDDIIEAMSSVFEFIKGMEFEDFNKDDKTVSAVIRKFEIIGEAAKNMPQDIKEKHQDIPWSYMAKMRDKLIHGYFGVDNEIIWEVIKKRFPEILPKIENLKREIR